MVYLDYLKDIAIQFDIPVWLLGIILIWTAFWKLFGLWKSARNKHLIWFIVIAIINPVGILSILYIYVFSKMSLNKKSQKNSGKKVVRKKSRVK